MNAAGVRAAAVAVALAAAFAGCRTESPPQPEGPPQPETSATPLRPPAARWEVVAVSECPRPARPEGLSGVTRLGKTGSRFLSIDDRGGLLWTLDAAFDGASGAVTGCTVSSHVALEGVNDGEGCAWDPLRQTVWVSDETGPHVSEHDPQTGRRLGELALTDDFRRIRPNRGPEGLTISPDGLTLWTCPEEAVAGDGPLASPTNGTLVRLHRYVRDSGAAAWRPADEVLYVVDPFGGRDYGGKFYRIRLYANQGYSDTTFISLAEFTFVDADGNRIDIPNCSWTPIDGSYKTYHGDNIWDGIDDASGLAECEAQLWGKGNSYYEFVKAAEGPEKLFDDNVSTVHGWWYYWGSANIVVRLPGAAATVAGYKMTRGQNDNAPLTWSLEGSTDGKEWTMLDDRRIYDLTDADQLAAAKAAVPAQKAEYNGGVPYRLESLTDTSLAPFGALTPITVAAGATYAASDPTTRLDALSVDLAQEGHGSVSNFTVAANGRLTVANGSRPSEPVEVPLTFTDMKETANFKTWTVVFGGKACDDLVVRWRNGSLYVIPRKGSVLIVR